MPKTSKAKSGKTTSTDKRARSFAFVMYDDSASLNWKEQLNELHVPYMYIYHDKDVNPTGEPKKPHYHVLLYFAGKKSVEQVSEMTKPLQPANGQVVVVESLQGMARYLTHMDNPDKVQYDSSQVVASGMDYISITGKSADKYKAIREMIAFVKDNGVEAYSELLEYASVYNEEWFHCLCDSGTMVMREYIKSNTWKADRDACRVANIITLGEVGNEESAD